MDTPAHQLLRTADELRAAVAELSKLPAISFDTEEDL
jgi:hypothetical protein